MNRGCHLASKKRSSRYSTISSAVGGEKRVRSREGGGAEQGGGDFSKPVRISLCWGVCSLLSMVLLSMVLLSVGFFSDVIRKFFRACSDFFPRLGFFSEFHDFPFVVSWTQSFSPCFCHLITPFSWRALYALYTVSGFSVIHGNSSITLFRLAKYHTCPSISIGSAQFESSLQNENIAASEKLRRHSCA